MRILFQKISSVFLALMLILSTISFTVEKHFCGDSLVNISFLGDAGACQDEPDDDCADSLLTLEKDSCCKNEITYLEGQYEINKAIKEKSLFNKINSVAVLNEEKVFQFFGVVDTLDLLNQEYSPPQITYDIQLLYEVFII
ncbi:HYC_CC_PP family protein [Tenacibaculum xiamenense]|uniref:HYC_CC_PP family protein n=1 Tax=Tenacibaculum xiamenense TaxID=1261553 RepID=UPI003893CD02